MKIERTSAESGLEQNQQLYDLGLNSPVSCGVGENQEYKMQQRRKKFNLEF